MMEKEDPMLNGQEDVETKDTGKDEILKSSSLWSLLEICTFRNPRKLHRTSGKYGAKKTPP